MNQRSALLSLLAVLLAAPAFAESGAHRHRGFFLHLDGGLGYLHTQATSGTDTFALYGGSGVFDLQVGGALTDGLILSGALFTQLAPSPSYSLNGSSGSTNNSDVNFSVGAIGPALTYYFLDSNVYLTAMAGVGRLSVHTPSGDSSTNAGFAARLLVGKEWWVSESWGLGLNGQFTLASNGDQSGSNVTWGTYGFALAFSATYN